MSEFATVIYVKDAVVHKNFYSEIFKGNPWYIFGEVQIFKGEEFYTLTNVLNGKMAEIRSKVGPASEPRKALISFVCETVEDLNIFGSRIEKFGGRIVREALEVAPGTTILWGQDPSGLHFGLTTLNHNNG